MESHKPLHHAVCATITLRCPGLASSQIFDNSDRFRPPEIIRLNARTPVSRILVKPEKKLPPEVSVLTRHYCTVNMFESQTGYKLKRLCTDGRGEFKGEFCPGYSARVLYGSVRVGKRLSKMPANDYTGLSGIVCVLSCWHRALVFIIYVMLCNALYMSTT